MAADIIQVCQDGQVVLWGVAAAAARSGEFRTGEQVSARSGRGRLAATNNEQPRYAISNRVATTASMLQRSAENLRRAGHVPARRDIIFFTFQTAPVSGFNDR